MQGRGRAIVRGDRTSSLPIQGAEERSERETSSPGAIDFFAAGAWAARVWRVRPRQPTGRKPLRCFAASNLARLRNQASIFLARKNRGANFLLQDFSNLRARQVGPDVHLLRRFDAADTSFDEMNELFDVERAPGVGLDDGSDSLAPLWVGQTKDGAVHHARVLQQRLFDLDRIDVEAAGDDHVLRPVDDVQEVLFVEIS